jgi:hypothetical protein
VGNVLKMSSREEEERERERRERQTKGKMIDRERLTETHIQTEKRKKRGEEWRREKKQRKNKESYKKRRRERERWTGPRVRSAPARTSQEGTSFYKIKLWRQNQLKETVTMSDVCGSSPAVVVAMALLLLIRRLDY